MHVQHIDLAPYSWKPFVLGSLALVVLYAAWKIILTPRFSPLRDLPGPKNPSLIYGHLRDIFRAEPGVTHEKWVEEYGLTMTYKMLFNVWQKPPQMSKNLAQLLGNGLVFAEGETHKRQRRILNPSFSIPYLRDVMPIFLEKSAQLRDAWLAEATQHGGSCQTDVLAWLSKATLDIIGLAGFDYEFNSLNPDGHETELSSAFRAVIQQNQTLSVMAMLQTFAPFFGFIPTARIRSNAKARKVMDRIGHELVANKKRSILAAAGADDTKDGIAETKVEKGSITSRDLLSRLVAANMATDLRESQRLTDEEVFAQIPTFLLAGHDTTATATTWCLYALARDPEVQAKLRNELLSATTTVPSMEELNGLPYLDAVVRETQRLHSVVPGIARTATEDDIIPLGTPFKDRHGVMRDEIRLVMVLLRDIVRLIRWDSQSSEGRNTPEAIHIPSLVMNTYKGFWGDGAKEFRPERWLGTLPEKTSDIPGVWSHIMTFIGGPRSCIGYRFALLEMKCLLWTLVRAFNIEFVDPASHRDGISKMNNIIARPFVTSEPDKGTQLPLKLTPWRAG